MREQMNLSQREFARQMGVRTISVLQWESGRRRPRVEHVDRMETLAEMNHLEFRAEESAR